MHIPSLVLTETFVENISSSFPKIRKWWWYWHVAQSESDSIKFNWL